MMLENHTNAIEKVLLAQSLAARNAGHPNLRGGPREWFIRDFLENHLPSNLEIGQGEIINENSQPRPSQGEYRPQADIVIYRRDLPKIQYSKDNAAYFAEGVIATIESKSVLTKEELQNACKASQTHKNMYRNPPLYSFGDFPDTIITYIVAYDGPAYIETVARWLPEITNDIGGTPNDLADMIIVLGKGVVWKIDRFRGIPTDNIPKGRTWAFTQQKESNLFMLFTHFLTWCSSLSSPPDTTSYASNIFFQEFDSI